MDYKCKILTPIFIYGANPSRAELRTPSIKGGLRFWWRALNPETDLEQLKKQEGELFGNTDNRSKILLRLKDAPKNNGKENFLKEYFEQKEKRNTSSYKKENKNEEIEFISYGVSNKTYLKPSEDKFTLIINEKCQNSEYVSVENALKMLTFFGGLGGKARNGFGSFEICEDGFQFNEEKMKALLMEYKDVEQKNYTAFSKNTRLFKMKRGHKDWEVILKTFAEFYKKNKKNKEMPTKYRKYIGYPGEKLKGELIGIESLERHSKSFFFNIIKNGDKYEGVLLYMPYNFLSEIHKLDKISLETERNEAEEYKAAHTEFLKAISLSPKFKEIRNE